MKSFEYDKKLYLFDVLITGVVSFLAMLVLLILALLNILPIITGLFAIVAAYSFWNTFIAKVHPKIVTIEGKNFSFTSVNRTDHYNMDELTLFKIREFPSAAKIYLRINGGGLVKGRYWINAGKYEDGKELFMSLLNLEYEKHPDSLKAIARRKNTFYNEKVKGKKAIEMENL
ncbi:hypothetical protein RyT2_02160 [Pseudolactococcus yaeyamensis]